MMNLLKQEVAAGHRAVAELALMQKQAINHLRIISEIPRCRPDGTGLLTPIEWVQMAKKQLGYPL